MANKEQNDLFQVIGGWAFLVGVIIAVIFGAIGELSSTMLWVLMVIGVIIGLLNVTEKEVKPFLFSGVALVIVSALSSDVLVNAADSALRVLNALLAIFVPATIIVALRNVLALSSN